MLFMSEFIPLSLVQYAIKYTKYYFKVRIVIVVSLVKLEKLIKNDATKFYSITIKSER